MQPRLPQRRPIRSDARPDVPLVYERLSDPILVTRAKAGDRKALAALCERHAPRVERLALHLLRDPEDARDAAQDSLAKLVVRIRQFRGESQFSTWLHRLVVNTCKDFAQARAAPPHRAARSRTSGPRATATRVAELTASETRRELGRRLAELPPRAGDRGRAQGRVRRRLRRDLGGDRACPSARPSATPTAAARRCGSGSPHDAAPLGRAEIEAIIPHRAAVPARRRGARARPRRARRRPARPSPRRTAPAISPATRSCRA